VLGGNRLAVMPLGIRVEVEGVDLAVLAELPAGGQIAPQVERVFALGVVLDELIVDPRIGINLGGGRAVRMPVGWRERVELHRDDAGRGRGMARPRQAGGGDAERGAGENPAARDGCDGSRGNGRSHVSERRSHLVLLLRLLRWSLATNVYQGCGPVRL